MKGTITVHHPQEDMIYKIHKGLCKVVWEEGNYTLLIEVESTDELDHVEGDSYQNDAPKISLNIEDFRIDHDFDSLDGQKISIPESIQELEDKDGEKYSLTYSTLFVEELDETFLTSKNQLSFTATEELGMKFTWKGKCEDFYSQNGEIAFTVEATVGTEAEQEDLYDYDE